MTTGYPVGEVYSPHSRRVLSVAGGVVDEAAVEFAGARGDRIRGWCLRSAGSLFTTCAESFEAVWAQATPHEW